MHRILVAGLLALVISAASSVSWASAVAAQSGDSWVGPDKALHYAASIGLSAGGYALGAVFWEDYAPRLLLGAGVALSLGVAKELFDLAGNGTASWRDMTWNIIGISAGLLLAFLVDLTVRGPRRQRSSTLDGARHAQWDVVF